MTVRSGAKLDYEAIKQYKLTAMNSEGTATVTLYTIDVQTYLFTITLEDAIGNRSDALMLSVRRGIEE